MPRRRRFVVENAYYHILNRGNNRQRIFLKEADYKKFLELMQVYFKPLDIAVIHYVIMSNHYHLILRIKSVGSLKRGMQQLNQVYARYFRKVHGGAGYLWQGRYKSFVIESGKYLLECGIYIELNPVRAGIVKSPDEYKWSSYRAYGKGKKDKIITISPEYEGLSDSALVRAKKYEEYAIEKGKDNRQLKRYFKTGVCGSSSFAEKLQQNGLIPVWSHSGRPGKKCSVV